MTDPIPPTPKEIYVTLAGPVDAQMVQRVFQGFALAIREQVETVHILIQSGGGNIGDGIAIYNYLRKLPLKLISYNGGTVASIAVLIFLAASERMASNTATFMIHKSHFTSATQTNVESLEGIAKMLRIDDARIEEILKEHIALPSKTWKLHERSDITITAREAVDYRLIKSIADFQVPPGNHLYNLNG